MAEDEPRPLEHVSSHDLIDELTLRSDMCAGFFMFKGGEPKAFAKGELLGICGALAKVQLDMVERYAEEHNEFTED